MRIPISVLGRYKFRVVALRTLLTGPLASAQSPTLIVQPGWNPAGSRNDYRFMAPDVRWNPCQDIGYRVNATQARPGALKAVQTALSEISNASGLRFVYRGTTENVPGNPNSRPNPSNTQLVIAWANPTRSKMLGNGQGVLGMGGPVYYPDGYQDPSGRSSGLIIEGRVVMNTQYNSTLGNAIDRKSDRVGTLMHEIGHAVGLGHAPGNKQKMYGGVAGKRDYWGAGDLEGLRRMGFSGGCVQRASGDNTRSALAPTQDGVLVARFEE